MKKTRIKFFVLSIMLALSICLGVCLTLPKGENAVHNGKVQVYASCQRTEPKTITGDPLSQITTNRTPSGNTDMGDIPFSIYTAEAQAGGSYSIVDYMPTFAQSESNGNYYYTIADSSIPYILLSSQKPNDNPDPNAEISAVTRCYNTTFYFKFNDPNITKSATSGVIGSSSGTVGYLKKTQFSLQTPYSEQTIDLWPDFSHGVNDAGLNFAVNLLDIDSNPTEARCPTIDDPASGDMDNYVGGGDVSFRTGLYTIKLDYLFTSSGVISSHVCHFEISFYIIDYSEYVKIDDTEVEYEPLTFENSDLYTYDDVNLGAINTGYHVFNYNYSSYPNVYFDATKFAFNFTYTVPSTKKVFEFRYKKFEYDSVDSDKAYVYLSSEALSNDFEILVQKNTQNKFIAKFDLEQFQKYIISNSGTMGTTSFQGTYEFDIGFLTRTNMEGNFSVIDKDTFDLEVLQNYNSEKLLIFGYELKYNDKTAGDTYGKDIAMQNEKSWTSFISHNSVTGEYAINFPEIIAVTNQAPLRFSNYGNLYYPASYQAHFYKLANGSVTEDYLLNGVTTDPQSNKPVYFGDINAAKTEYAGALGELNALVESGADQSEIDAATATLNEKLTTLKDAIEALENNINDQSHTYTQGLSISGDGLYIMLLQYRIKIDITLPDDTIVSPDINGKQIVVFQINNTPQTIYPHAVERTDDDPDTDTYYTFNSYTSMPVRISTIDSQYSFYAPYTIDYAYYANFNQNGTPTHQDKLYKKQGGTYLIGATDLGGGVYEGGTTYQYYVTGANSDNYYTFKDPGTYVVTIKYTNSSSSSRTIINIDNKDFEDIAIYNVDLSRSPYYKDLSSKQSLTDSDFAITNEPFTLSWKEKESSANSLNKCSAYIIFMSLDKNENVLELYKEQDGSEYWLTNNYTFDTPIKDIERNYENSYSVIELTSKMFFRKDGLYFFYVYDKAGNHFVKTILLDSTSSAVMQGRWSAGDEMPGSEWTEDIIQNEANYISEDTVIYFGSQKALKLPEILKDGSATYNIEIKDMSFSKAYNANGVETAKDNINIFGDTYDLYAYLKTSFAGNVQKAANLPLISANDYSGEYDGGYYLLLANTSLQYSINDNDFVTISDSSKIAKVKIYKFGSAQQFFGENRYLFVLSNQNGSSTIKGIEMYFDIIQGTFYAYKETLADKHIISKNSGTNLNVLVFEYTDVSVTEDAYNIESLKYEYYPFDYSASKTTYPFAESPTPIGNNNLLNFAQKIGDYWTIDGINVNYASGGSLPGKYVITRVYQGGAWDRVLTAGPDTVQGSDGYYYKLCEESKGGLYKRIGESNEFRYLFDTDSLIRTYTVYVDRNNIISTTYDESGHKEIGDNITVTLNASSTNDTWSFIDFYKMLADNNDLITNKIPIKINIPLSKYYFKQNDTIYYATRKFAKLNVTITYAPIAGATKVYEADTNNSMGMLTCSELVSENNPYGEFIFSGEGKYTIYITDNTGYNDYSKTTLSALNIDPNTFEFSFYVTYLKPEADIYSQTFAGTDDEKIEQLIDIQGGNKYATNIKNNGNEVYVTFDDPATPYEAKITTIIASSGEDDSISITFDEGMLNSVASNPDDHTYNIAENDLIKRVEVTFYDDSEPETFDGIDNNYYRYTYTIYLNLEEEKDIQIVLLYSQEASDYYIGTDGENFSQSDYTVSIDRKKPYSNINALLSSDTFLESTHYKGIDLSFFLEENFDVSGNNLQNLPSIYTYSFPVKENYTLIYNQEDTLSYFYVRSYSKFDSDIISDRYPSITPDMTNAVYDGGEHGHAFYDDEATFAGYPKFSEVGLNNGKVFLNSCTWYQVSYANQTLANLIKTAMNTNTVAGYYEIIEKDLAGNYRAFTVYYPTGVDYSLITYSGIDEDGITVTPTTKDITKKAFSIDSLQATLGWAKITFEQKIGGNVKSSTTVTLTPYANYIEDEKREEINSTIFEGNTDRAIVMTLTDYNSAFAGISRTVFLSSGQTDFGKFFDDNILVASNNTYTITLPPTKDSSVNFLTYFKLELWQNGNFVSTGYEFDEENEFETHKTISNLPQGRYRILYKENSKPELLQKHALPLGEFSIKDANKEFVFENGLNVYKSDTNTYYSGGSVTVTYEGRKYKVYVNGVLYSGIDEKERLSPEYSQYDCKTFVLSSNYSNLTDTNESCGGTTTYEIKYYDSIDTEILQKTVTVVIFDKLPQIILSSPTEEGVEIPSSAIEISSLVTNTGVKIDWGNLTGAPIDDLNDPEGKDDSDSNRVTQAYLYKKNDNGQYEYTSRITRGTNDIVLAEGSYKIEIVNKLLGNMRPVYFRIQRGDYPLYSVIAGDKEISPSSIEKLDLAGGYAHVDDNEDEKIVKLIYSALSQHKNQSPLSDVVQRNLTAYDLLSQDLGFDGEGNFDADEIGLSNITSIKHYYTIKNFDIAVNSIISLNRLEFVFINDKFIENNPLGNYTLPNNVGSDYYTKIYILYTFSTSVKVEVFAVTKVPEKSNLLNGYIYTKDKAISLTEYALSKVVSNDERIVEDGKTVLSWNKIADRNGMYTYSKWYNQGNYIYVLDKYGYNNDEFNVLDFDVSTNNVERLQSIVDGSGLHILTFKDLAGNTHRFQRDSRASETYSLTLLDRVIYYISYQGEDLGPVQYGVFNDELSLVLDPNYLSNDYYTANNVTITATRNGVTYNITKEVGDISGVENVVKFKDPGKYVVTIKAQYNGKDLNPAVYNFTIISTSSSRLAFEFVEVPGYEIVRVVKNDSDITANFAGGDGKIRSLFLSSSSSASGNGNYVVTLKYGQGANDTLEFAVTINDYMPTLYCNVERGGTTTGDIILAYDSGTIYQELGVFTIRVLQYNADSNTFYTYASKTFTKDDVSAVGVINRLKIDESNTYFIQLETENGNVITSFKVTRTDPLNAFAIFIIIAAVVGTGVLVFVIIKLRTKMRIR